MNRILFTDALIDDGHQQPRQQVQHDIDLESATRQKKANIRKPRFLRMQNLAPCEFLCDQVLLIFVFFEHREAIQPRSRVCLGGHGRAFKRS